jgi:hypothetical protein
MCLAAQLAVCALMAGVLLDGFGLPSAQLPLVTFLLGLGGFQQFLARRRHIVRQKWL